MKTIFILFPAMLCLIFRVAAQNFTQTVRGTVLDKSLQTSLPGATIILLNSNPVRATTADETGNFRLTQVPVGRHTLEVKMMGYKDFFISNVEVTSGKEVVLTASLEEDLKQTEEVVIQGERDKSRTNNSLAVVSAMNLRSAEINRYAGSRSDPSRMAASFAGVAGGGDQRNDIIVRGNSPWGVLWRLEGVDIPNPNHFTSTGASGGAFSILNNNLLANSDFLTGAFPAEYGNKSAAVFDVRLRKGNNEKRENTFQIGLNGLEFVTEGPLSKPGGGSYLASGRLLSFKAIDALGVKIGANGIPQYQDATFKITLPTGKSGQFSLWGIGGMSSIKMKDEAKDMTENYVEERNQTYGTDMYGGGVSHTHYWGEKTTGVATISASGSTVRADSREKWTDKPDEKTYKLNNTEGQFIGQYVLTHKWNRRITLKTGATGRILHFNNQEKYFNRAQDSMFTGLAQQGKAGLIQTYAQGQYRINEKLTLNPGLYFQHFTLGNASSIEPRFSGEYQASDKDRFTLGVGLHSQSAPLYVYQYRFQDANGHYYQPNLNLGLSKSLQMVAGYRHSFSQNLHGKAEAYFQHLYQMPVSHAKDTGAGVYSIANTGADFGFNAVDSTVAKGTGRNYGIELSLEKNLSQGYYFLTNVSLFRSTYVGGDGVKRSTAFDLGHVVNVLAGKEFHLDEDNRRLISADIKITHMGGRKYIPIDVVASQRDNKTRYDYAHAYEPRVKDYFRTDVKVTYQVNRPKANHQFFIAADNVLNTQNVFTKEWNNRTQQVQTYYQMGVFPYLGYRVQF